MTTRSTPITDDKTGQMSPSVSDITDAEIYAELGRRDLLSPDATVSELVIVARDAGVKPSDVVRVHDRWWQTRPNNTELAQRA